MVKYYGTKRTAAIKRPDKDPMTILYLPNDWELSLDTMYVFQIRRIEEDTCCQFCKKITKVGRDAQRIIINAQYGIKPGEMVVFSVEEMDMTGYTMDIPMNPVTCRVVETDEEQP